MTRPAPVAAVSAAVALVVAASLLAGCHRTPKAVDPPAARAAPASGQKAAPAPALPGTGPWAQLAALDARRPVPLLPVMALHQKQEMQGHLVAIQGILAGLAHHDFGAIARSAKAIGSSPEMAMMCRHMGAGAPGFTKRALAFHREADAIAAAAKRHDRAAVVAATARTLSACTGCHATFRQDVEGPAAWKAKTGMPPPAMATGGP